MAPETVPPKPVPFAGSPVSPPAGIKHAKFIGFPASPIPESFL